MIIEYILVIVALIWILVASIYDIKTREIPDGLSYSLIGIGLGLRLINSIVVSNYLFFFYGLIGFGSMFIFGMIMYYSKQWGGGDCKLLMGLGAVFGSNLPTFLNPVINFPFLIILLFNILIAGGIYGIVWSLVLVLKNKKGFLKEFKKIKFVGVKVVLVFSIIFVLVFSFIKIDFILYWFVIGFGILFLVFMLLFMKVVEKCCMYKKLSVDKLTEGDWVAEDIIVKGKTICSKKDLELTKEQIGNLKKLKIKKVLIKEGIPFVPSFLFGLLITLIWGNLLFYIL